MLTKEEKEQLETIGEVVDAIADAVSDLPEPTPEEKEQLVELKETFGAVKAALDGAAIGPTIETAGKLTDLSKLVNGGNLKILKEKIADRMPVTDAQYDALIKAMKDDVKSNSRLNGLIKNVSAVAETLVTKVLPLFIKAAV